MRVVFRRLIGGRLERQYFCEYGIVTLQYRIRISLGSLKISGRLAS
jgi:uncharacterized membrane protein